MLRRILFFMLVMLVCFLFVQLILLIEKRSWKKMSRAWSSPLDRLAVDHAGMVLHAYQQQSQGKVIDFSVPCYQLLLSFHSKLHKPKPQRLIAGWGFYPIYGKTGFTAYKKDSMMGMLGVHHRKKKIVFSFRNTQQFKDIGASMGVTFTKRHGLSYPGYLHHEYVKLFKTCISSIEKLLDKLLEEEKDWATYQLVMTGHSLGGSLATIMSIYMAGNDFYGLFWGRNNLSLITFGAPYVLARYKKKDFRHTWLYKKISYVKCFERSTDPAPAVTQIAKFRLVNGRKNWVSSDVLRPVPIAAPVLLFHYNNSQFNFVKAHDFRKYRKAIYGLLKPNKRGKKPHYVSFYT
ncbi:MAG: lipase family protein [Cytophagales bacterium]